MLGAEASSHRQRFLEAFRLRSDHATAITEPMRAHMAARLLEEFGTPQAAADAIWALARANNWYREGEGAERYLLAIPPKKPRTGSFSFSAWVYKQRDLVERYFNKLKHFRDIAT